MEILKNIEICGLTLFIRDKKILVIGDLHLGFEESLNKQGVLMPRFQFDDLMKELKKAISKTKPKKIVIVGDIKHEFGTISEQEWRNVLQLIDFLREKAELIIVKGNHDVILEPITKKRNVKIKTFYYENGVLFAHGDAIINEKADIILIPSMNKAVPGSDITKGNFLSPYLEKTKNIEVYIIEDKVYKFGKLDIF